MSSNSTLNLSLLSPERKLLVDEPALEIMVTTAEGQVQIFPGHADYVTNLETGVFHYVDQKGNKTSGVISFGFIRVVGNRVVVMAETLELAGEVDASRARAAQIKAEEMLKQAGLDEASFKKYNLKLQRAVVRQSL